MPSTVYRGDLAEISFGHESGVVITHGYDGSNDPKIVFEGKNFGADEGVNTSTFFFDAGVANTPVNAGVLCYPLGMLVGSQLVFSGLPTALAGNDNKVFTIVKHELASAVTRLTISPALTGQHATNDIDSVAGTVCKILPFKTPTFDTANAISANANASAERVMTDQFLGIVNTIALPDTKVDLKRMHVVGVGRDVAVQVPGRFINQGGSFEANLHNARWFYYALGHELSAPSTTISGGGSNNYLLKSATEVGATYIELDDSGNATPSGIGVGDYVVIQDTTTTVRITTAMDNVASGTWPTVGAESIITQANPVEVRKIVGFNYETNTSQIWLDSPLDFAHAENVNVDFIQLAADNSTGSPNLLTTGEIQNPQKHLYFSQRGLPSFALEVSVRRNSSIDDNGATEVVDGGSTDSKQLTRVFRGCKVKDFVLTADSDAALRMTTNFDAALCYTDTGRLEGSNQGDRYDTHKLFDDASITNVADNLIDRKKMGLAKGTQKPFMFYNGTIKMAGTTLGQVVSFTLNGKTGVEQHYVIGGITATDSVTDRVPFAGSRNASLAIEGKTEYELEMEIIVDDPLLYHNMRRAIRNFDETVTDATDADMIRLSFIKQGSASVAVRESIDIIMDDYFITEAPLPIPEDKGPMKATLKIMPKNVKVVSQDTILHA